LPIASTTKIVTALTVLENLSNIDQIVQIDKRAVGIEGSSIYLREGEKYTVRQLLYGLMLQSGNDCAVQLALTVANNVENFANLMNLTAKKCGATESNFVNPHGLHNENHYSTAYDLAKITSYALQNETFAQIVKSKLGEVSLDNPHKIYNKNKLLKNWEFADGVKTGFTKKAGRCFVGSATKDGMQLVAVVLNCGPMFEESKSLLEYGFENWQLCCIIPQNKMCGVLYNNGKLEYYYCPTALYYPLSKSEKALIEKDISLPKNQEDGHITVSLDKHLIFSQKLVTLD
ncbi:MAG: D-alanyl-D-alanine carboxypeptidase, partial [Clostridia bacterium]|nr:D-alanyl-D-alanine carboxypeptidase [Clostridia bacterium]